MTGARENNLKDITIALPKRRLTVFTGVTGSGKDGNTLTGEHLAEIATRWQPR